MKKNIQLIKIRAVSKLLAELEQGEYIDPAHSAIICCTDEAIHESSLSRIPNCRLQFLDTENPRDPQAFTREDAAEIRRFLDSLPDHIETLYCCCDWGQSRSAGLAAACMSAIGQDCETVFRNPSYTPNLLVYATMREALGCGLPSRVELDALRALRTAGASPDGRSASAIKRILVTGDAAFFGVPSEGCENWPSILAATSPCEVKDCRTQGRRIPITEKEFISDKHDTGRILPGDLLIVLLGIYELRSAVSHSAEGRVLDADLTDIRAKMRKYLLWLKYVNQGVSLLLISPFDPIKEKEKGTEETLKLADCYRSLAAELGIGFVDLSHSNQASLVNSQKNRDEMLAADILSYLEKRLCDHERKRDGENC